MPGYDLQRMLNVGHEVHACKRLNRFSIACRTRRWNLWKLVKLVKICELGENFGKNWKFVKLHQIHQIGSHIRCDVRVRLQLTWSWSQCWMLSVRRQRKVINQILLRNFLYHIGIEARKTTKLSACSTFSLFTPWQITIPECNTNLPLASTHVQSFWWHCGLISIFSLLEQPWELINGMRALLNFGGPTKRWLKTLCRRKLCRRLRKTSLRGCLDASFASIEQTLSAMHTSLKLTQ